MYEVVLTNVSFVSIEESGDSNVKGADASEGGIANSVTESTSTQNQALDPNSTAYLYVRWNKTDDVLIEQPLSYVPETDEPQPRPFLTEASNHFDTLTQGAAESAGTSGVGASAPASAPDQTPSA